MVNENTVITFYRTAFRRGQVDVSSNVALHLSRLQGAELAVAPMVPRRDFSVPVYAWGDLTNVTAFNYAAITFPTETAPSSSLQTLFYFCEWDMDAPENTQDVKVMRFYLDPWACFTSFGEARSPGAYLMRTPGGVVVRGHTAGGSLLPPVAPPVGVDYAQGDTGYYARVTVPDWNDPTERVHQNMTFVIVASEARPNNFPRMWAFTLGQGVTVPGYSPTSLYSKIISLGSYYGADDAVNISDAFFQLGNALALVADEGVQRILPSDAATDPQSGEGYEFGALSVEAVYLAPMALFQGRNDENIRAMAITHGGEVESVLMTLYVLGADANGTQIGGAYTLEELFRIPVDPLRVQTFGNTAHRLTFAPLSAARFARARVTLDPATGSYGAFISDGENDVEITQSVTLPINVIADAQARETAGVRDVLSAASVAGSIAVGAFTANPAAVASGVMSAASLAADITSRTYAANRQSRAAVFHNICSPGEYPDMVCGMYRVEVWEPLNAPSAAAAFDLFGWDGERYINQVGVPDTSTYIQYAPQCCHLLAAGAPEWLREDVVAMLEGGVRIWNDEDRTRYPVN